MEELVNVFHYIRIPVIIAGIAAIIWRVAPLSSLTADIVEIKLFSKEKKFLVKSIKYLFNTFVAAIFILTLVDYIVRLDSVSIVLINFLAFIVIALYFFYSYMLHRLILILKIKFQIKFLN